MQRRLFLSDLIYANQVIYSAGQRRLVYARHASELRFLPEGNPPGSSPLLAGGFSSQPDNVTFRCDMASDSWPGYFHPGSIQFSNRIVGILHDCLKGRTLLWGPNIEFRA